MISICISNYYFLIGMIIGLIYFLSVLLRLMNVLPKNIVTNFIIDLLFSSKSYKPLVLLLIIEAFLVSLFIIVGYPFFLIIFIVYISYNIKKK